MGRTNVPSPCLLTAGLTAGPLLTPLSSTSRSWALWGGLPVCDEDMQQQANPTSDLSYIYLAICACCPYAALNNLFEATYNRATYNRATYNRATPARARSAHPCNAHHIQCRDFGYLKKQQQPCKGEGKAPRAHLKRCVRGALPFSLHSCCHSDVARGGVNIPGRFALSVGSGLGSSIR
jgi:hypothetical protein